jgi:hypothetical protein
MKPFFQLTLVDVLHLRKEQSVSNQTRYLIKFKQGDLADLRARLLQDLSREHFAVLLGKTHKINGYTIITKQSIFSQYHRSMHGAKWLVEPDGGVQLTYL